MTEITCESCAHWTENTGWNDMVGGYGCGGGLTPSQTDALAQHNREAGLCQRIIEGWEWESPMPLPLATCWDGSQYKATLHTHKSFGCVLWEAKSDDAT